MLGVDFNIIHVLLHIRCIFKMLTELVLAADEIF